MEIIKNNELKIQDFIPIDYEIDVKLCKKMTFSNGGVTRYIQLFAIVNSSEKRNIKKEILLTDYADLSIREKDWETLVEILYSYTHYISGELNNLASALKEYKAEEDFKKNKAETKAKYEAEYLRKEKWGVELENAIKVAKNSTISGWDKRIYIKGIYPFHYKQKGDYRFYLKFIDITDEKTLVYFNVYKNDVKIHPMNKRIFGKNVTKIKDYSFNNLEVFFNDFIEKEIIL